MKFSDLDSKIYEKLSQTERSELKQIAANHFEVSLKTLQRWFLNPECIPDEYSEQMKILLADYVDSELKTIDLEISSVKSQLNRTIAKKQAFQDYLETFITFKQ